MKTIEVHTCYGCPAFKEGRAEGRPACKLTGRHVIWRQATEGMPDHCPLNAGPVMIMKEQSAVDALAALGGDPC